MKDYSTPKSKFLHSLITLLLFCVLATAQNYTPLPYFNGFETAQDTAGWTFKKRPRSTGFEIGSAVHCLGSKSLYISPDSGSTATYNGGNYVSVAYKSFTLPAGTYDLAFDYQLGGDGTNQGMKVAWVPATTTISGASTSAYPIAITANPFTDTTGVNTFGKSAWRHVTGTVTVPAGGGTYNLCFAFSCNNQTAIAPGACIDNIQLDTVKTSIDCTYVPYNIQVAKDANGVIITWNGNATEYEVIAAPYTNPADYSFCRHTDINTTTDTMLYSELSEGQYFFYVRAICGSDTSMYGETNGVLIYDASAHCIDISTFNAPGTQCTYGSYSNPYQTSGYIDNGPSQMSSRHTVHTDLNETDPRTLGALNTVPPGEMMSIRLGNWNPDAEAESITYTYNVPTGSSQILILKYAVLFEEPGHSEPPEFMLEIMNVNNTLLDPVCTIVNPLCDGTLTQGWHSCSAPGSYPSNSTIWWKEWSTIGVNISAYAGQTIKVRLTTKDCDWGGHFGYAYFTLNCTNAVISGISCNAAESAEAKAPDGFNYQWTNNCTNQVVSIAQALPISGTDSCSYTCRCSYKENDSCYFTLTAYTLHRLPESSFSYSLSRSDCQTHITFSNNSQVYVMMNGVKTYLPNERISAQTWSVNSSHRDRSYHNRISGSKNLQTIAIPKEGDTISITLTSWANNCDDDTTITIYIPALQESYGVTNRYVCQGQSVIFNGKSYTFISDKVVEVRDQNGGTSYITGQNQIQVTDTLATSCGCDSVLELNLRGLITDTTLIDTTIYDTQHFCLYVTDTQRYVLLDTCVNQAGLYIFTVPSSLGTCDSLVYMVNLNVIETPNYLCFTAEDATTTITLNQSGNASNIYLMYSVNDWMSWQLYTIGQSIQLSSGDKLYFSTYIQHPYFSDASGFYYFNIVGHASAEGNIMSLIDGSMQLKTVPSYAFHHLFQECASLTSAPELPATTLGDHCYESMFAGCTSLTETPDLPATTLSKYCYANMFERCAGIEKEPTLTASTLAEGCYSSMFANCVSLLKTPALSATLLAENCYNSMFRGCTSLSNIPELPASALTNGCYSQMFMGCTSLSIDTVPPGTVWQIPAYAVAPYGQWNNDMFLNTGGQFTGDPEIGRTYYVSSDTLPVAVQNMSDNTEIILWPNPVHVGESAYLNIDGDDVTIDIFTITGIMVKRIEKHTNPVTIDGLPSAGAYIIRITDNKGKSSFRKLIVE